MDDLNFFQGSLVDGGCLKMGVGWPRTAWAAKWTKDLLMARINQGWVPGPPLNVTAIDFSKMGEIGDHRQQIFACPKAEEILVDKGCLEVGAGSEFSKGCIYYNIQNNIFLPMTVEEILCICDDFFQSEKAQFLRNTTK